MDRPSAGACAVQGGARALVAGQLGLDRARASASSATSSIADRSRDSARRRRITAPPFGASRGRPPPAAARAARRRRAAGSGPAMPRDVGRRRVGQAQVGPERQQQQPARADQRRQHEQPLHRRRRRATTAVSARRRGRCPTTALSRASRTSPDRPCAASRTDALPRLGQAARRRVAHLAQRGVDLRPLHRRRLRAPTSGPSPPGPRVRSPGSRCSRRSGSGRSRRTHRVGGQPSARRRAAATTPRPRVPMTGTPADVASASTRRPRSAWPHAVRLVGRHRRRARPSTTSSTSATSRSLRARRRDTASASSVRSSVQAGSGAHRRGQHRRPAQPVLVEQPAQVLGALGRGERVHRVDLVEHHDA